MSEAASALVDIRNMGVAAHIDAGKTTTTERILFYSGYIHRVGDVDEGTTVTDWMEQEKERGITIQAAAVTSYWKGKRINLIDTPGHVDFTVEVERSMRVLDGVVIVLCAVAGVQPQTHTVWKQAIRYEVPRILFVNKMDRVGCDFYRVLEQAQQKLPGVHSRLSNAVAIQLPIGSEDTFSGWIDLLEGRAFIYDQKDSSGQTVTAAEIPENLQSQYSTYHQTMLEAIVETDDELMTKYLENGSISVDELRAALRRAVIGNRIVPVLCGAAFKNKGIQPLLDAIIDYLPSPHDKRSVKGWMPDGSPAERPISPDQPLSALAFKVVSDPFVGRLTFLRIYSGKIKASSHVLNARTGRKERISRLLQIQADQRVDLQEAFAGDIVAAIGANATTTGDTICNDGDKFILEAMRFPTPVISVAIEPKNTVDIDKLATSIARLAEEDPTFKISVDPETGQTIVSGMGELHLEIIVDRLLREFNVRANVGKPQVAYRETITKLAKADGEFIRQTGGRGQFGRVTLQVEPLPYGAGFEFVNKIVAGAIPKEYIPAVEEGIRGALLGGVLAGYPMIDVKATLIAGKDHETDSSPMAFQVAGSIAFKEACNQADPVLLEPVMTADIEVPDEFTGDIIADLSSRRGQIQGMESIEGLTTIRAHVPLSEMFGYATSLRNGTKGLGTFQMELYRYEEVAEGHPFSRSSMARQFNDSLKG